MSNECLAPDQLGTTGISYISTWQRTTYDPTQTYRKFPSRSGMYWKRTLPSRSCAYITGSRLSGKHNEMESLYVIDSCLTSMIKRGLAVNV